MNTKSHLQKIQRQRRFILVFIALFVLIIRFLGEPMFYNPLMGVLGIILVGIMAWGRTFCMGYLAERKKEMVVNWGPFSLCRNPLYLFSVIGGFGIGLLMQSWLLAFLLSYLIFLVFNWVIRFEEQFLLEKFQIEYLDYYEMTPRWLPRFSNFKDGEKAQGGKVLRLQIRTFIEAIIWLAIIYINPFIANIQQTSHPAWFLLP